MQKKLYFPNLRHSIINKTTKNNPFLAEMSEKVLRNEKQWLILPR